MPNSDYSRRTVLRRSLATAGAAGLVSTAGCSSIPNPFGGGVPYAGWLPAPDEFGDNDHYQFTYFNLGDLEENEDELSDDQFNSDILESLWSPLEFDLEDASHMTLFGSLFGLSVVVEADYTRDDAVSTLEDEDYEEDDEYEGYTIMLSESEEQVIALNGSVAIITSATDSSGDGTPETGDTGEVETLIDAKTGNVERYQEANEDMQVLIDELGGGTIVDGTTTEEPDEANPENGQFENMVAEGSQAKIDGDTATQKWVIVYDGEDDPDEGDLEDWVDENDSDDAEFDNVNDISYNTSGRKGIITGTADLDEI